MHDRREPTLSAGDSGIREQEPLDQGPIFREPPDRNSEEPSLVFWVAAIALGILLGGVGVKLITSWYESRQAEAVVRQFVVAMAGANEQSSRQLAADARTHAEAVAEKQRAQEAALNAEKHRIERLRITAAEQATAEKTRRDAAWAKFYRPSAACQDPGSRATIKCANEFARAQKEFQQRWSQGSL